MSQPMPHSAETPQAAPIKVLVVDDSAFMRKMVGQILLSAGDIEVVGSARDGEDALEQFAALQPDVVTLDIEMPKLDGIAVLKRIMATRPTPVVIVSSLTQEGAETTLQCLDLGAVDFVGKPSGSISLDIEKVAPDIVSKVRMAAGVRSHKRYIPHAMGLPAPEQHGTAPSAEPGLRTPSAAQHIAPSAAQCRGRIDLLLIGASTGGPRALQTLVPTLPGDLGVPVVIVQHMPPTFTATLAKRLDAASELTVREAAQGDRLTPNVALVAPGGYHLEFDDHGSAHLNQEPLVHGVRPAIDITIASLTRRYGKHMMAVLLTGMGKDGARGLKMVRDIGGHTIAEHESSCVIYGMPRAAVEMDAADSILPLHEIAPHIAQQIARSRTEYRRAA